MRRRITPLTVALAMVLTMAGPADAVLPYPGDAAPADPHDYSSYLYLDDGSCSPQSPELPSDFVCQGPNTPEARGRGSWKFSDHRDPPGHAHHQPQVANNPQELYGVKGVGVNRAWEVSTGRPDVVIAVLDSGIRWEEDRDNLLRKHYLNRGELPIAGGVANPDDERFDGYDVNGDGFFNVDDYIGHADDLNGNGDIDPEDLIRTFSDGIDDDGNGYPDDISGWDFFENDNNPQDDSDYGHGTGEAEDSGGEAELGGDGQCPNCMVISMRVGDSFIADVHHWAEAVVYAVDNGASVVQEALGTLNHTSFGQAAADYAYENGVIINASEADEAAGHHNWPAAYDHTMVVNSVRTSGLDPAPVTPNSYLYFNGCTNFGGYTYVSIPSTGCSSEATGRSSGVSGLLYSAARNAVDTGDMTNYITDGGSEAAFPLSVSEAMQLWRLSADDIDLSSDCLPPVVHDFCDDPPPGVVPSSAANNYVTSIPDSTRYQSVKGWDYFFGYGRNNAARLLRFVGRDGAVEYVPPGPYGVGDSPLSAQDRIPPEADITSPRWWRQYGFDPATHELLLPDDPADPRAVVVRGRVAANRVTAAGGTFDWVLEWAPHVQGLKDPLGAASAPGSEEQSHGPWTRVPAEDCAIPLTGRTQAHQGELCRIDVEDLAEALASPGNPNPFDPATDPTSEWQPERFAVRLRVRVIAHPANTADTVNNEAVFQKQIDVYPAQETLLRDDIGLDGQPAGGAGAPSFHDLDGDGEDEMLLPTEDGVIHAYTNVATGRELPGWPVETARYPGWRTTGENAYTAGALSADDARSSVLVGTLAAADLDDDGELEVTIGDLEGRLYAWEADGSPRPGFPVTVDYALSREPPCDDPGAAPACDDYATIIAGSPTGLRDRFNDRDWGINSAPAIGDLDPTTPGLEIVVGSNDGHVYAWHEDGTPVRGWPVFLRDPEKVAAMDPDTRHVTYVDGSGALRGVKVLVSPSLGDLDADGDLEVVIGVNEQYEEDPNADFSSDPLTEAGATGPGNTRVYALHHTGAATPGTAETEGTPHTHDQAYVAGWPVPIAMLVTDVLPYVGEGTTTQAALADIRRPGDSDPQLEVVFASVAGPGYILNHDGSSFLGTGPSGEYRTMSITGGPPATDYPSYFAVGQFAVGSMDGGTHLTAAGPAVGLKRALDILVPADQAGAEDHLSLWNASSGHYEPNAPFIVNDLQFFTEPVIADVDGDGLAEAIQSTAVSDLVIAGLADTNATATRHFTGGWGVTAAAVGDAPLGAADGGVLHVAHTTREGYLRLFPTGVEAESEDACVSLSEWPQYGHDAFNSGNYRTDAERPSPITDISATVGAGRRVTLSFTATGDDRRCGAAEEYRVRVIPGLVPDPRWERGEPVALEGDRDPAPSGRPDEVTFTLPPGSYTVMLRAYDDAATYGYGTAAERGNGSAVASEATGGPGGGGGVGVVVPPPNGPDRCPAGPPAANHVVGTPDAEVLRGTPGRDVICGLGGRDRIRGGKGKDLLLGGPGRDLLAGGRGRDLERGHGGKDRLRGGPGRDLLRGGPGRDHCTGGGGRDRTARCERGPRR